MYTGEYVKSYMKQFKVNRIEAIKQLEEILKDHYENEQEQLHEVYSDIKRNMI